MAMVGGTIAAPGELQAVLSLGDCSAILVEPDVVLTSAHCIQRPIQSVSVAKRDIRVSHCEAHPGYRPLGLQHDVGYCKLASATSAPTIGIGDGSHLAVGQAVTLAGYGASAAFAHDAGMLRVVETSAVRVLDGGVEVGAADRTACWGDSGGPVLVRDESGLRVVGIIHGVSGAICASPAEAALLDSSDRAWLEGAGAGCKQSHASGWMFAGCVGLALFTLTATVRWWRTRNRAAGRDHVG